MCDTVDGRLLWEMHVDVDVFSNSVIRTIRYHKEQTKYDVFVEKKREHTQM